jgi:hypothetical protein
VVNISHTFKYNFFALEWRNFIILLLSKRPVRLFERAATGSGQ